MLDLFIKNKLKSKMLFPKTHLLWILLLFEIEILLILITALSLQLLENTIITDFPIVKIIAVFA